MCPRGQGRPEGLQFWSIALTVFRALQAHQQSTLFLTAGSLGAKKVIYHVALSL